jgi:hypothetical protein
MHSSILLALWAGVSFVLYQIISSIIVSRRHAAAARQLGCKPAYSRKEPFYDLLGIKGFAKAVKADKNFRIPQFFKQNVDEACKEEGKVINTFTQNIMGTKGFFTVEPKNIQAILATQFKDFGLGERRNNNFAPLLGFGIVSDLLLLTAKCKSTY